MGHELTLKFDRLPYQDAATAAVCAVFAGQPRQEAERRDDFGMPVFANAPLALGERTLLENLQARQAQLGLPQSQALWHSAGETWPVNLDVEMETGTGKTYVYTQTAFALHKRYGWGKFVVVVPGVAIREGVKASLAATAGHFFARYGERARVAVYDSRRPGELSTFANTPGLNILIINMQAFNARGEANRRIRMKQDDAGSNAPLELLAACRPILILDEPQKLEGKGTVEGLKEFDPLFVLRYSATHATRHDLVYRLDALDAYNQKLVKKIEVTGLTVHNLTAQTRYRYLAAVEPQPKGKPKARLTFEKRTASGAIARVTRLLGRGEAGDLFALSGGLPEYRGYTINEMGADAAGGWVRFLNGETLRAGEVVGHAVEEAALREIQLRETIRTHLLKESTNLPIDKAV